MEQAGTVGQIAKPPINPMGSERQNPHLLLGVGFGVFHNLTLFSKKFMVQ
jgi:hypothetical protein